MSPSDRSAGASDARRVVIAGAGVAAVEAALALRDLAGDRVALSIVSASAHFVYRPLAVVRPFQAESTYQVDLTRIARDLDAEVVFDSAVGIDAERHRLLLSGDESLDYEALVIAIGARAEPSLAGGTITPWDWGAGHSFRALLGSLRDGRAKRVTFVVPVGIVWPLPLYELALLTSAYVRDEGLADVSLTIVTVERMPLEVFGPEASARVDALLRERGITVLLESETLGVEDGLLRTAGGAEVPSDATVAVPVIRPRAFAGVPTDRFGFIVVDDYCRVAVDGHVFAAGDCTSQPLKQGGIAAQQADVAASGIAELVGADVEPAPLRPRLQALLFTGDTNMSLGSQAEPEAKIEARYLTPYLRATEPSLPSLTV